MLKILNILFLLLIAINSKSNVIEKNENGYFLTNVLSDNDIKIYRNVIFYQQKYQWDKAENELLKVENPILAGHFKYEKLMHPHKYRASYQELSEWFKKNYDYPPVLRKRVYNLLIKRLPNKNNIKLYEKPLFNNYLRGYGEDNYTGGYGIPLKTLSNKKIEYQVTHLIHEGKHDKLVNLINNNSKDNATYLLYFLNKEIKTIFFKGDIYTSMQLYDFYITSLKVLTADIFFRSGINAYRLGSFKKAKNYFNECNKIVKRSNKWLYAGCSYWTSLLENSQKKKIKYLKQASNLPRTLYGQLAIEKLNIADPFIWKNDDNEKEVNLSNLNKNKIFKRAIALSEIGLYNYADLEIRNLYSTTQKDELYNLFYASEKLDLPAVLMRLGSKYHKKDLMLFMRGLYPTPDWELNDKYKVDKALLFALIRRESAFNFKAKSSKGARGLMQIMPRTASKINNDYRLRYSKAYKLYSLQLNIEIGQKFLNRLINRPNSKNSILDTLIAYNAGITRLKKWKKNINNVEPIVFIESLPIKETRWFVKYILTDLWIYRDKLRQAKPSRVLLAEGKWPKYKNLDYKIIKDAKFRR